MGGAKQTDQDMKKNDSSVTRHVQWVFMEADNHTSDSESIFEDSTDSEASSCSSDILEDASSSSSSSSSPPSCGPLYELSELMAQLPIKRGLSKYYEGKSQSFGSLASVKSLEDLAKKGGCYGKRMKPCKSYGGGLDGHNKYSPKATITKNKKAYSSRGSFLSSLGKRL